MKEITYKSLAPGTGLSNACRMIKEMQKKAKQDLTDMKEAEGAMEQGELILNKHNPIKIDDVFVRPHFGKKRFQGRLEAHVNGFLYTDRKGDQVKILYNTVKHAFFQPCSYQRGDDRKAETYTDEPLILFHFHLKHGIMLGKKQFKDISFYAEVGEVSQDLNKSHGAMDRDEIEEEQRERQMKKRITLQFTTFLKKVEEYTKVQSTSKNSTAEIEFNVPFRELAFSGVPGKSSVLLQPTTNCLVNLTELPTFVLVLDEVERVHFERVDMALKTFDMQFIFKDYTRKVQSITTINMKSKESIQNWLDSIDIKYTEGASNINWAKIMKFIIEDPESFF